MKNKKIIDFINSEFKEFNCDYDDAFNNFVKLEKYITNNEYELDDNDVKELFNNSKLLSNLLLVKSVNKNDNMFINYLIQVYDSYKNQISFLNKFREYKKGNIAARNEIVNSNKPLVIHIALKYQNQGLDLEDLVQEGNIGLMYSLNKYDPNKGLFSTYSSFWIKQNIKRAIDNYGRNIRISSYRNELIFKVKRANDELEQVLNRRPTNNEIATYLNVSNETIDNTMVVLKDTISFDSTLMENDLYLSETITDDNMDLEEILIIKEEYEEIKNCLDILTEKEKMAVKLRYGFIDNNIYTLNEISVFMNVSIARVHNLLNVSLRKLKSALDFNRNNELLKEKNYNYKKGSVVK